MRLLLLSLFLTPLLLVAEDRPQPAANARKGRNLTAAELRQFYTDPTGRIVTDWVEQAADTKIWRSFTNAGYATVLSEGRMQDGEMVFRKGFKYVNDVFPDAERPRWYTYNGIDQKFFDDRNTVLLKEGYTLMRMQRFTDSNGDFRFCAIWVKFAPGPKN